jgi:hypothetical protein
MNNSFWLYLFMTTAHMSKYFLLKLITTVHCTKRCIYSQKVLLRMGEFVARNM